MRKSFPVLIPAGGTWPESQPDSPTLASFNWIRIHNRSTTGAGTADCVFDFDTRPRNDPATWFDIVLTGRRVVRNLGSEKDPMKTELHILNLGASPASLWVEVSDHPIVDISDAPLSGVQTLADADGQANSQAEVVAAHLYVYNGSFWDRVREANIIADAGTPAVPGVGPLILFNGANYDRLRSVSGNGDGLGVLQAMQPSTDNPPAFATGVNAAATITFNGVPGQTHRLTFLAVSYAGGAAAAGTLTVNDGTNIVVSLDLTTQGVLVVPLPPGGISGRPGQGLACSLSAGGVGITGKINAAKLTA